ncbi:MAG: Hypothetical protein BHV28_04810 [Candidatus Tokpelaia hoelldobleri]|uniref:Uncharacterized protein n=1 Tax=Candidatus Tokpelaia hoelldobleri TaxID=1902579 RepID=A0A1U9JTL0_9HYPH|nr:MAG: Hypothetical protein BHV28_04810 [Candidatus Tokpelaia hoelldoblerii]
MMIVQSILFFVLGGAVAAFIMALFAPVVWQRAVFLARKAVHSEMPLSLMEVEADRDFLRVQHTVALSRLEQKLQSEREDHFGRRLALDHAHEQIQALSEFEPLYNDVSNQLDASGQHVEKLQGKLAEREQDIEKLLVVKSENSQLQKLVRQQERVIARLEKQNERLQARNGGGSGKVKPAVASSLRKEIKALAASVVARTDGGDGKKTQRKRVSKKKR